MQTLASGISPSKGGRNMPELCWEGWTPWQSLAQLDLKSVTQNPGAYAISAGKPISRAIGIDSEGILDIGESRSLRQRLRAFIRCATRYGDEGHMAGWRFGFFRYSRHFPFESLLVRWREATTKQEAYELEGRMLVDYLHAHGELPPLNYSFNWSPFRTGGWDLFDRMIGSN